MNTNPSTPAPSAPHRMPTIFLSHGAPPLADDRVWTRELADWSSGIPRPQAILVVSAHWEEAPVTLGATTTVPLYYDFYGFPGHYYEVRYPAPGAPALAEEVRKLLRGPGAPLAGSFESHSRSLRARISRGSFPMGPPSGRGNDGIYRIDRARRPRRRRSA